MKKIIFLILFMHNNFHAMQPEQVSSCDTRIESYGFTPLMIAAINGVLADVKLLLSNKETGVNDIDCFGKTALHYACFNGFLEIVVELLKAKVAVNIKESIWGTPLHHAVSTKNLLLVTLLLKAGAQVDATDYYGNTPLMNACSGQGNLKIIELLISNNADVNKKNTLDFTPLYLAALNNNKAAANLLIENDADVDALLNGIIKDNDKKKIFDFFAKQPCVFCKVNIKPNELKFSKCGHEFHELCLTKLGVSRKAACPSCEKKI